MSQFEFGSYRFGWDEYSRIAGSTTMYQGSSALLPGEPLYTPLPFTPTIVNGDGSITGTTDDGHPVWSSYPSRCDLFLYEGDDVVVPLFFNDPDKENDNLATGYEWFAQIRQRHDYRTTLISPFSVVATFHPSETSVDVPDVVDEYTQVEMFLPRYLNKPCGFFEWEVASYSPTDYSRFPQPEDWPIDVPWPPPDTLKTWLYGRCVILPRTTTTDYLPLDPAVTALGPLGFVVTSNGAIGGSGYNPAVGVNALGGKFTVPQP